MVVVRTIFLAGVTGGTFMEDKRILSMEDLYLLLSGSIRIQIQILAPDQTIQCFTIQAGVSVTNKVPHHSAPFPISCD